MSRVIFSILLSLFVCLYSSAQKVITLDTAVVSSTNEYATNDDFETDISTYAEKKIKPATPEKIILLISNTPCIHITKIDCNPKP